MGQFGPRGGLLEGLSRLDFHRKIFAFYEINSYPHIHFCVMIKLFRIV